MITFLFVILMVAFVCEVMMLSIKLAWGLFKGIAYVVAAIIVGAFFLSTGLAAVAVVGLVIAGIVGLFSAAQA